MTKQVSYLVKGWNVTEEGAWVPFSEIVDYKQASSDLMLMSLRNTEVKVKVDSIQAIYTDGRA